MAKSSAGYCSAPGAGGGGATWSATAEAVAVVARWLMLLMVNARVAREEGCRVHFTEKLAILREESLDSSHGES
ncbi:hypothetical protein Kpho01_16380 [Kitasatospora phosalacinea]|uniref:Uncharacterized protein n=1 Tax=Kitasatospora phosalacinea TaxID=2065 RepID=A0A9W6PEW5_9ACTN|nr:hypothetical protein Kpho01_16380 [Kitasatospora phosalacinea]